MSNHVQEDQSKEISTNEISAEDIFDSSINLGDNGFRFRQISAWIVNAEGAWIAPISRVYIGSEAGELVFSRSVNLGGVLDLMHDLSKSFDLHLDSLKAMNDFFVYVPEDRSYYEETLREIKSAITSAEEKISQMDIRNHLNSQERDGRSEEEI